MFANLPDEQKSSCSSEMLEDAQATLSSADLFADKKLTSSPMWSSEHLASPTGDVENNTTEKHTKRQNVCACFLTAWKAVRHLFQVNHHIPNPNPIDGSFDFLYEVGEKLGLGHHGILFEGIRKSDGKHVAIKFAKKRQPDYPIELAGYSKPLSREAAIMLMLQKPPNGDHVIQLYDWFVMAKQNILIMEYPRTSMTLLKFIQRNRMRLTEATAKSIMQQLIVALQHCKERCVYRNYTGLRNILINPHTMQLKLTDFGSAQLIKNREEDEPTSLASLRKLAQLITTKDLHTVLDALVNVIRLQFWKNAYPSKECLDLLKKLQNVPWITLEAILNHDWFQS